MNNDTQDKDPLFDLFKSYRPELSDTEQFDRTLDERLRAAEMVREHQRQQRRTMPLTLIITFVVGVACGIATTLLTPGAAVLALNFAINGTRISIPEIPLTALSWTLGAAAALAAGMFTYRLLTLRLQFSRRRKS